MLTMKRKPKALRWKRHPYAVRRSDPLHGLRYHEGTTPLLRLVVEAPRNGSVVWYIEPNGDVVGDYLVEGRAPTLEAAQARALAAAARILGDSLVRVHLAMNARRRLVEVVR